MVEDKVSKLEEALKPYEGKNILIALRGPPDPDSISSAIAHQRFLKTRNIGSTAAYVDEISHQENKALVKALGIDFVRYDGSNLSRDHYQGYSLVDSQTPDPGLSELVKGLPLVSVVDHHDESGKLEAGFVDIDLGAGATATQYAEYFEARQILVEGSAEDSKLATALMHGIRSDTDDLLSGHARDHRAAAYLDTFADKAMLRKISLQEISPKSMEVIIRALKDMDIRDNYLITGEGVVRSSERDAIPQAADFILRRTGVDTVLVYGIIEDHIDCSFRTTNGTIRPADFIKEAFPDVKEGHYGGRYDKGGFQLPLDLFRHLVPKNGKLLTQAVDRVMDTLFFSKLGVETPGEKESEGKE